MHILPKQSKLHLSSWDAARRPDFFVATLSSARGNPWEDSGWA